MTFSEVCWCYVVGCRGVLSLVCLLQCSVWIHGAGLGSLELGSRAGDAEQVGRTSRLRGGGEGQGDGWSRGAEREGAMQILIICNNN